MQRNDKGTLYTLTVGALLVLLLGLYILIFTAPSENSKGFSQKLGSILSHNGEIKRKHKGESKWNIVKSGASLFADDILYVGPNSLATLNHLGKKIELNAPGYYFIQQSQGVASLHLSHGALSTILSPREDLRLGEPGKDLLIKTQRLTQIAVTAIAEGLEIRINEGQLFAEALEYRSTLKAPTVIILHKDGRVTELIGDRISLTQPSRGQRLFIRPEDPIDFKWAENDSSQEYQIAVSSNPTFKNARIYRSKLLRLQVKLPFPAGPVYWRVINSLGEQSSVGHFSTHLLYSPQALSPLNDSVIRAPASGEPAEVEFRVKKFNAPKIEIVLAKDPNFFEKVGHVNLDQERGVFPLEAGEYFWKVRSHYTSSDSSNWSQINSFRVMSPQRRSTSPTDLMPSLKLAMIPNLNYPEALYSAEATAVKTHLSQSAFLKDFFSSVDGPSDSTIELAVGGQSSTLILQDKAWPARLLEPGSYNYRYRIRKPGILPSTWSEEKQLAVSLQAPRSRVPERIQGQTLTSDGKTKVKLQWTPLLFAKKYELVITDSTLGDKESSLVAEKSEIEFPAHLSSTYTWKVRALSDSWIPISPFSTEHRLQAIAPPVLRDLASDSDLEDPLALSTAPTLSNRTSFEKAFYEREDRGYFWGWLGSGLSFLDYSQSQGDSSEMAFSKTGFGAVYVEGGFMHHTGLGARLSYKRIPGQIEGEVSGEPEYTWSNFGAEALYRLGTTETRAGSQVAYALNMGVLNHTTPHLYLDSQDRATIDQTSLLMASFGGDVSQRSGPWTYEALLRYEHPLSSSSTTGEFLVSPTMSFSGALGMSYNVTKSIKAGFFWYGHWLNHSFTRTSQSLPEDGSESLFFSNMDLRLGFDF